MGKKFMFVIMTLVITASIVFSPSVVPAALSMVVHGANPAATAPTANFTGDPTSGPAHLQVQFTDSSLGNPSGWAWYFGDEDLSEPWIQMTMGAEWTARYGHSSVSLSDGSIVLMGGQDTFLQNDVWRSTDQGATWTQMTPAAEWTARTGHSSVALPDGSIVLMGGWDGGYYLNLNDVWRSTDQGATWTQMTPAAEWSPRRSHTSVVLPDGSIVLMGGGDKNDVWRSTNQGATWTQMTAAAEWVVRSDHTSVALPDGSIVLMGGGDKNDVWRSTDWGENWTQMTAAAEWVGRRKHTSVALPDGNIVLMGGYVGGLIKTKLNDVWRSTDQGTTWMQMTDAAEWTAREDHSSVALPDGGIIMMGGSGHNNTPRNEVWRSTDQGGSWMQMTKSAAWAGRMGQNSVALPDGSIVLMGGYGRNYLNDVWHSSDQGTTWMQMTANAEWTARWHHSSVALPDGGIILMGGNDGSSRRNDIWRSTDQGATWMQKTAAAPWTARSAHTSVVLPDGSIILMGGNDGSNYLNDIWRSTDQGTTWMQKTAAAPWTARWGHSSVVLPDGGIVMMGGVDGSYRNDVWRSTDQGATWTQMTDAAPWIGRTGHSSVALPDGSIVLIGGYYWYGTTFYKLSDVWRSTDQGVTWSWISSGNPWVRWQSNTSVALPDGSIVLISEDPNEYQHEVWRLETAGSSEQHPTHIYTELGTYTVALQVFNADAVSSTTRPAYINVTDTIPDPDPDGFEFFLPLILR